MLKKTVTYTDYDGNQRTEDFYFNLNKVECLEMEASVEGGYTKYIDKIAKSNDMKEIVNIIKLFLLKSYGEKSADGKRFIKIDSNGVPLSQKFEETEAFVELYVELASDATKCSDFINGIMPNDGNTTSQNVPAASNFQN